MTYEKWYELNEDDLRIECAESGADREYGFDFDDFCEERYFDIYLNTNEEDNYERG